MRGRIGSRASVNWPALFFLQIMQNMAHLTLKKEHKTRLRLKLKVNIKTLDLSFYV